MPTRLEALSHSLGQRTPLPDRIAETIRDMIVAKGSVMSTGA